MKQEIRNKREVARSKSNNPVNPNKNICALAVADVLGVADNVRFLHTQDDVCRAIRTRFSLRSRLSKLGRARTVGAARAKLAASGSRIGYIVFTEGHVFMLDAGGRTIIDTDPRKRDARRVRAVYAIFPKAGL